MGSFRPSRPKAEIRQGSFSHRLVVGRPKSREGGVTVARNDFTHISSWCDFVEFSLPRSEPNSARPLLRFAAVQFFERVERPTSLAPKACFIATEAIEREIGKIGESQKTAG